MEAIGWRPDPNKFMHVLLSSKQIIQRICVSLGTVCKIELSQESLSMYVYMRIRDEWNGISPSKMICPMSYII